MPKLRHLDNEGTTRFITFNCYCNLPGLATDLAKYLFLEELASARHKHGFSLLAYVILPEHVHLVLLPPDGMKLGLVVGEMKSRTARRYFAHERRKRIGEKRVFWQKRCYDHNCRTPETTIEKIRYCHNNPVRQGLVAEPGEWVWSSYNCYHGIENVPLVIDKYEM